MNWEAISALAEALGALAVLVTLIYLSIQVRQSKELLEKNERLAHGSAYQQRALLRSDFHGAAADSEFLAPVLAKTNLFQDVDAIDDLTEVEKLRLREHLMRWLIMIDNTMVQHELGQLDIFGAGNDGTAGVLEMLRDLEPFVAKLGGVLPPPRLVEFYMRNAGDEGA